jgi:DNA-binding response OmpR family regulator
MLRAAAGAVPAGKEIVDLNTNTLSYNGQARKVWGRCAELAQVLVDEWPNAVGFDRLKARLWSRNEGRSDKMNALRVYASVLRQAIRPLNMDVLSVRNVGYRFVFNVEGNDECRTME